MKSITAVVLTCVLAMITGCASKKYTPEQIGPESYNYKQIALYYFQSVAKDPDSVKMQMGPIKLTPLGWRACARVNAKNSFGGYVGDKGYLFTYRNGKLVKMLEDKRCLG
ncbi:hypothetical protein [Endozoicomonas atrinae]|uniref:hypothetical protein n=1 Tax=Endozoicomonas atrinae TaxID=1333660 RepID=UPI003B00EC0A